MLVAFLFLSGLVVPEGKAQAPIRPATDSLRTAGETFWVDVTVGSPSTPVQNLFGTSFVLRYDASRVSVERDEAGPLLGSNVVYQSDVDSTAGEVDVGVSRKAGAGGVDGNGTVARIKVTVPDTVSGGTTLAFGVEEGSATDSTGGAIPLNPQTLDVTVRPTPPIRPSAPAVVSAEDTFQVDVVAGSDAAPAQRLFGTSFVLDYDASALSVVRDQAGPFLGSDVVYQSTVDGSAGEVDVGVSRKSGAGGVDGSGVVARVRMTGAENSVGRSALSVSEVTANDPAGASIPLSPETLTIETTSAAPPTVRPTTGPRAGTKSSFWIDVTVGSNAVPVQDLFGLSFSLVYESGRVSVADDEAGALLGSDVIYQSNVDSSAREVGIGITRKSGAGGVGGQGVAARVKISVPDSLEGGTVLRFPLDEVSATNAAGTDLALEARPLTVSIPAVSSKTVDKEGTVDFEETGTSISFSKVSGQGTVTVEQYKDGPTGNEGIEEKNVSDYRTVIEADESLGLEDSAEVQLAVQNLGGIENPENVTIYKRDNPGTGSFTALETSVDDNGTPDNISDDTLTASTASFSEFALASDTEPLPVELAGFDARLDGKTVRLTWTTASETGNAGFQVQRRTDERDQIWTAVGRVNGAGTTTEPRSYQYVDAEVPYDADRLTYRLKQRDIDGSTSYSEPITVRRTPEQVRIEATYPNPAREQATVQYALPERQMVTVRLYDALGRQVQTVVNDRQRGRREQTIDVSGLASGVYFLRFRTESQTQTEKLTVVQ
jgi:hypothetical protein